MTQPNDTTKTNTRDEAISRLAQAMDNAREQGMTSWGIADALAVAMWETHGIDMNGRGTNVEMDEPGLAIGIDSMTATFQQEVDRG